MPRVQPSIIASDTIHPTEAAHDTAGSHRHDTDRATRGPATITQAPTVTAIGVPQLACGCHHANSGAPEPPKS